MAKKAKGKNKKTGNPFKPAAPKKKGRKKGC
jgi:hypothetical protein